MDTAKGDQFLVRGGGAGGVGHNGEGGAAATTGMEEGDVGGGDEKLA